MQLNQRVQILGRSFGRVFLPLLASVLLLQPAGAADSPAVNPDVATTIRKNIQARFPGSRVLDVRPSAVPGLYELFMGDQIVYSDATGDHVIVGSMLDTQSKENLTEASLSDRGQIDFNALPLARAIKIVKGNGSRKFAVFSDPDCPFCQQLEKTLLSVTDTTMYVFLFPIASLHPQAPAKAHAIWCAPDRAAAWNDWMHQKKLPASKTCTGDPIDALQKLGDELHINSTPTLFFANGKRLAGALPAADLEKDLAAFSSPRSPTPTPK
jgi:thiol:disulfide interchange protein DsbC